MSDFRVVDFVGLGTITSLQPFGTNTLKIVGKDLTDSSVVRINGAATTSFIVQTPESIIVDIPEALQGAPVQSVSVLKNADVTDDFAMVSLNIKTKQTTDNSVYVLQKYLRLLLMSPGSDIFYPNDGGGLYALAGSVVGDHAEVRVMESIKAAERMLLARQTASLPAEKRLVRVETLKVNYSIHTMSISVELRLHLADGDTVSAEFKV